MYESDEVSAGMSVHIYHEFIKATLSKSLKAKLVYLFFFQHKNSQNCKYIKHYWSVFTNKSWTSRCQQKDIWQISNAENIITESKMNICEENWHMFTVTLCLVKKFFTKQTSIFKIMFSVLKKISKSHLTIQMYIYIP